VADPNREPHEFRIKATFDATDDHWRVDVDDIQVRKGVDTVHLSTGDAQPPGVVWFRDPSIIGPDPHLIATGTFSFKPGAGASEGTLTYGFSILVNGRWTMVDGQHSPPRIRIIDKEQLDEHDDAG